MKIRIGGRNGITGPWAFYFPCFCGLFCCTFLSSTTFVEHFSINEIWMAIRFLSAFLIILKIIIYDRFSIRRLIATALISVMSIIVYIVSDRGAILDVALLVIGSYNIEHKKLMKTYITLASTMLLLTFICSITGVIVDYTTLRITSGIQLNDRLRHSFGINYSTDFAAHVFYIYLSYLLCNDTRIKKLPLLFITIIIIFFLEYYCNARLSEFSILLSFILYCFIFGKGKKKTNSGILNAVTISAFPMCAIFSIVTTLLFDSSNPTWLIINQVLFSGRLSVTKRVISQNGIKLFGQSFIMQGLGYKVAGFDTSIGNTYIDSSYMQVLFLYGIIMTVLIIAIMTIFAYKTVKKDDAMLMMAVIVIAINCIINQYLINIAYNPLFLIAGCYLWSTSTKSKNQIVC